MQGNDVMDRLTALIEAEREALISGDFDRIATLMDEKQALSERLDGVGDEQSLEPIRDGLRRNQELFDHALAGLRNVANRLGNLNRLRKSLETYDEQGRRESIGGTVANKLERRA